MRSTAFALAACAGLMFGATACGGTKKEKTTTNNKVGDDLDVGKGLGKGPDPKATGPDAGAPVATNDAGATTTATPDAGLGPNAPLVTFRLKNSSSQDVALDLARGWYGVIFAYTGERGKGAKSALMFPKNCTAKCSVPRDDRCPICKKPKGNKKEKEAQKREVIAPGKSFDVKWEGDVHKYKKTRGRRWRRCKCYTISKVKDDTYTVEAYGFHFTTSAKKRSKLLTAKAQMKIDGDKKQILVLEFTDPPPKKKKK